MMYKTMFFYKVKVTTSNNILTKNTFIIASIKRGSNTTYLTNIPIILIYLFTSFLPIKLLTKDID